MTINVRRKDCATGKDDAGHTYVLFFGANKLGVAKRVEVTADTSSVALDLAISDIACRAVEVWEDGQFLCRVFRERTSYADTPSLLENGFIEASDTDPGRD